MIFVFVGVLHEDLKLFLETNVPKSTKHQKSVLGTADSKISAAISEQLGIQCLFSGVVPEIIRGIFINIIIVWIRFLFKRNYRMNSMPK